jgi:hypothetical protein
MGRLQAPVVSIPCTVGKVTHPRLRTGALPLAGALVAPQPALAFLRLQRTMLALRPAGLLRTVPAVMPAPPEMHALRRERDAGMAQGFLLHGAA